MELGMVKILLVSLVLLISSCNPLSGLEGSKKGGRYAPGVSTAPDDSPNIPTPIYPSSSLTGLWHFNESSGSVMDSSVESINGSPVGAVTFSQPGRFGQAIHLDGTNSYISFGDISNYDYSLEFTISGWFNIDELSTAGGPCPGFAPMFMNYDYGWNISVENGRILGLRYTSMSAAYTVYSSTTVIPGEWYHFALVQDATTFKLYVNGVEEASVASTALTFYTGSDMPTIGRTTCGGVDYFFKGFFDDFAIWSRPLSVSEVEGLYVQP